MPTSVSVTHITPRAPVTRDNDRPTRPATATATPPEIAATAAALGCHPAGGGRGSPATDKQTAVLETAVNTPANRRRCLSQRGINTLLNILEYLACNTELATRRFRCYDNPLSVALSLRWAIRGACRTKHYCSHASACNTELAHSDIAMLSYPPLRCTVMGHWVL
ncbi:hypothetical protein J6590_033344 [Homalodisca vitripennis]|nr:hypothetical protein J6590_033344 [Homalodisca vitripennis]